MSTYRMPTTIYDSSLLTQRKRDKAIAQEIRRANTAGQAIIKPQTGYASYYGGEAANGAITYFRKEGACTNVNVSCNCDTATETINDSTLPINGPYLIVINISDLEVNIDIAILINGSGHIYWGDGQSEAFTTNNGDVVYRHAYQAAGQYTITIATYITKLQLSYDKDGGPEDIPWPSVTSLTLNNPSGLLQLIINCNTLSSITGLANCINLIRLDFGRAIAPYDDIYSLTKLQSLYLGWRTNLVSLFEIPPALINTLTYLEIKNSNIINFTNISSFINLEYLLINDNASFTGECDISTLTKLIEFDCKLSPVTSIGSVLPTSLEILNVSDTHLSGELDISNLSALSGFSCSNTTIDSLGATLSVSIVDLVVNNTNLSGTLDITQLTKLYLVSCSNTSISSLGLGIDGKGLPQLLKSIIINNTNLSGAIDISDLNNLESLQCQYTNISSIISNQPSSVTSLSVSNTQITGTFGISGYSSLVEFDCSNTTINNLGISLPPLLKNLYINNTQLSGTFDISGLNSLEEFSCAATTISNLGSSLPNTLIILDVNNTPLTGTLDISGLSSLGDFNCSYTSINSLGTTILSSLTSLLTIVANNTQLTGILDISGCNNLSVINCSYTSITDIGSPLPSSLTTITINNCAFSQATVEQMGTDLVNAGTTNGTFIIDGNTQNPQFTLNGGVAPWSTLSPDRNWNLSL